MKVIAISFFVSVLIVVLMAAASAPEAFQWSHSIAQAHPIVTVGEECTRPGATDAECVFVRVSLKGGDTLIVNRQTGTAKRCHAGIYEAAEKCKP